jgi:queuine tRNA-ribosyltransferase
MFINKNQCGKARTGILKTKHGEIKTPVFMPVGTRASVKSLMQSDLEEMEASIILGNTYHLYLRPGHDLIDSLGGLHKFMSWERPILTDSGGFQVFSLADLNKITDDGVYFSSHIDGSKHYLTPDKSMEIQKALGSDIVMCFDDCPPLPCDEKTMNGALERTLKWAKICRDYPLQKHQKLFGIIQGGLDLNKRKACMEELFEMGFEGLALGGLSVGEKNEQMREFLENFVHTMPTELPRYLMGVGKPLDVLHGIAQGLDMFDCVLPTRNARNGQAFTKYGPLNIKNARFKDDQSPLDPHCLCKICCRYTRAYLRHLITVGEYAGASMISYHNIHFMLQMVKDARSSIDSGEFDEFYQRFYKDYQTKQWKHEVNK